jgi:hypothetical protein
MAVIQIFAWTSSALRNPRELAWSTGNLLLCGLRFEIEWTLGSGMIVFLTSEILAPLFLAPIPQANSNALVIGIFSQKGRGE